MRPNKPCLTPGCGAIGPWTSSRCPECVIIRNRNRNAARQGRYNAEFNSARNKWATAIALGLHVLCARCGKPVVGAFDLDHLDDGTLRPSHPKCNRGARRNA